MEILNYLFSITKVCADEYSLFRSLDSKLGENKIKESKFFGDSFMFAVLAGNSGYLAIVLMMPPPC
jgi:hypothetical protein